MVKIKVRGLALLRIFWSPERLYEHHEAGQGAETAWSNRKSAICRGLGLEPPRTRRRTVERLDYPEVESIKKPVLKPSSGPGSRQGGRRDTTRFFMLSVMTNA